MKSIRSIIEKGIRIVKSKQDLKDIEHGVMAGRLNAIGASIEAMEHDLKLYSEDLSILVGLYQEGKKSKQEVGEALSHLSTAKAAIVDAMAAMGRLQEDGIERERASLNGDALLLSEFEEQAKKARGVYKPVFTPEKLEESDFWRYAQYEARLGGPTSSAKNMLEAVERVEEKYSWRLDRRLGPDEMLDRTNGVPRDNIRLHDKLSYMVRMYKNTGLDKSLIHDRL